MIDFVLVPRTDPALQVERLKSKGKAKTKHSQVSRCTF